VCGIVGIFDFAGHGRVEAGTLTELADSIDYRGPDDAGYHRQENLGFGFRRLSIIDVTRAANQPFFSEDRSAVSVCNGEIYNYRALRDQLAGRGHAFRSRCDVEILPHLYEEEGPAFVERLNGQFAFALYDSRRRRLMLARDHVGIAPLFYTVRDGLLIFASEIKAILRHPLVPREVDLEGLDQVLSLPGLVSPRTMFRGIHAVRPGHYLLVDADGPREHEYWDLAYPPAAEIDASRPESYYREGLQERLLRAVEHRLHADVPVGFYLSGGLDSSLIAGLVSHLRPGERLHSFSIGFSDADIDERRYQRQVADRVGSIHHEAVFEPGHVVDRLRQAVFHAEAPLKESYNTCSLALSDLVRGSGLKVVLTGEGSDELFAGYVGYRLDAGGGRQAGAEDGGLEAQLDRQLNERLWGDPGFFYERGLRELRETREALYSPAVGERLGEFACTRAPFVNRARLRGRHPVHQRSYLDFKLRLSDHLLADHGDRVAYANSVEARYPCLDVELIDFARTIPPALLLKGGTEKYILKEMARPFVPPAVVSREKFAFVAPGSPFLLRQDAEWIHDTLASDAIARGGYFDPGTVERLRRRYAREGFRVNQTFESDLLMLVLSFGLFLELFGMPSHS
jgi:asparagine synthase (glutamine-hydrolysing)